MKIILLSVYLAASLAAGLTFGFRRGDLNGGVVFAFAWPMYVAVEVAMRASAPRAAVDE